MGRTAHRGVFAAPSAADRKAAGPGNCRFGNRASGEREWLRVSGGERQLALVARALAQEPRILVLDEPTASLDFGNQVRVLDAVRSLAETRGLSVLLSTHHPEQAFACADRVAVLAGGKLLRIGAPAEVITTETLRACYCGRCRRLAGSGQSISRVCAPILPSVLEPLVCVRAIGRVRGSEEGGSEDCQGLFRSLGNRPLVEPLAPCMMAASSRPSLFLLLFTGN